MTIVKVNEGLSPLINNSLSRGIMDLLSVVQKLTNVFTILNICCSVVNRSARAENTLFYLCHLIRFFFCVSCTFYAYRRSTFLQVSFWLQSTRKLLLSTFLVTEIIQYDNVTTETAITVWSRSRVNTFKYFPGFKLPITYSKVKFSVISK